METYLNNPSICSKNLIFYVLKWKGTEKIGRTYTFIFFYFIFVKAEELSLTSETILLKRNEKVILMMSLGVSTGRTVGW